MERCIGTLSTNAHFQLMEIECFLEEMFFELDLGKEQKLDMWGPRNLRASQNNVSLDRDKTGWRWHRETFRSSVCVLCEENRPLEFKKTPLNPSHFLSP